MEAPQLVLVLMLSLSIGINIIRPFYAVSVCSLLYAVVFVMSVLVTHKALSMVTQDHI